MSSRYGELRPISGWDLLASLRQPCTFQRVSHLGSVIARHVSQTLRRWTEGATYVRQGDHHVGHWRLAHILVVFWVTSDVDINDAQRTRSCVNKQHVRGNSVILIFTFCLLYQLPWSVYLSWAVLTYIVNYVDDTVSLRMFCHLIRLQKILHF